MIDLKEKENCCGCGACAAACPKGCIKLISDNEGFLYPQVSPENCINCSLCEKVCPIKNPLPAKKSLNIALAAISKDDDTRLASSSGGVFSLIAEKIIEQGGEVYGAAFDENFDVRHTSSKTKEDLQKFRGSKYVQSRTDGVFSEIKDKLSGGEKVLFSGTPCEVKALLSFLRKPYENLYTVNFVCHGVPSPKTWQKYKEFQEETYESPIKNVSFRSKVSGWLTFNMKINFENGEQYIKDLREDPYFALFLSNAALRPSCFNCKFRKTDRLCDITIGDFWGVQILDKSMFDNKGTSLVVINSQKGRELVGSIKDNLIFKEEPLEKAVLYNPPLKVSPEKPKLREKYFKNIDKLSFEECAEKYSKKTLTEKAEVQIKRVKEKITRLR